jgi:3-hydroxy-3-methylglutaryl CoA synthase
MKKIGISQIGIAVPEFFISVEELSRKRKLPPEYGKKGLGVFEARIPFGISVEDLAVQALKKIDFHDVERFYFGTESDPDASKPIAVKVLKKIGLNFVPFQTKFACLGGLEALILACEYSFAHSGKPAVVLTFDRSVYSENDPRAEITQGCAALALRVEGRPKILSLEWQNFGHYASDIDDFFVPPNSFPFPIVDGELTKPAYLECQKQALEDWKRKNAKKLKKKNATEIFDYFVLHVPFPKMVEWAAALFWRHENEKSKEHLKLSQCLKNPSLFPEYKKDLDRVRLLPEFKKFFEEKIKPGLRYNPYVGNSYTSSIFVSLLSVLEKARKGEKIGLGGYGAGAGAICLAGEVMSDFFTTDLKKQIQKGKKLSIKEYEKWRKNLFLARVS